MPSSMELEAPGSTTDHHMAIGNSNELLSVIKDQISSFPPGKQYTVAINQVPVTVERLPYYPKEGDRLQDPGTARANIAASNESPNGTTQDNWARHHQHQTVCLIMLKYCHRLTPSQGRSTTRRVLGQGSRRNHLASRHLSRLSSLGLESHPMLVRRLGHQSRPLLSHQSIMAP
jgi:hypothetical protein